MCEESRADDLLTVLRELDAAKALLRQMQAQLNVARPALHQNGDSEIFQAACHQMNEASGRYRRAVDAFDAVCQSQALEESDRRHAEPATP
jgi:hypothetical protein